MAEHQAAVRAALFIDFDNVFLSLNQIDRRAAKAFAERPAMWLDWFEAGRHATLDSEAAAPRPRRILVRNCYLNPAAFAKQRAFFTRAAFTVVDCPALTARGKNSADILMAMDILDAIQHPTRFDEFLILSSDADFTPVLQRLRAHDRMTSVLTNAVTAAAFREACDFSVDLETFAVEALDLKLDDRRGRPGVVLGNDSQPPASAYEAVRQDAARLLIEEIRRSGVISSQDVFRVFTRIDAFEGSYWFGMGNLKTLLEDLVRTEPALFVEMDGSLPAAIRERTETDPPAAPAPPPPAPAGLSQAPPPLPPKRPLPGPSPANAPGPNGGGAEMARFVDDVYVLIGAPKLPTVVYGRLFQMLAEQLAKGSASPDALLTQAAFAPPKGAGVSRRDASYVIASLADSGALDGRPNAPDLARRFRDSIRTALANAGHGLDDRGHHLLDDWLSPRFGDAKCLSGNMLNPLNEL